MLTFAEVQESISEVSERMDELVDEIRVAGQDAAITEATFKSQFAKARLHARAEAKDRKITTDEAEDKATVATEDARLGYLLGANNLMVLREVLRTKQAQLDGLRTLAASHRTAGG